MGIPGRAGRKPKASTIHENLRDRPASRTIRRPPDYLTEEGKACWRRTVKTLRECGLIGRADADALALYCTAYERWLTAEAGIREHGMLVKTPNGFPTMSPLLLVANKAMEQMTRLLTEFGMTPASRSRIPVSQVPSYPRSSHATRHDADPRHVLEDMLD